MQAKSNSAVYAIKSMRFNTLDEWLTWQEELHFTAIELGLDRCNSVAERMGLLNPGYKVISIAGTNGKGSCASMLSSILIKAGYSVGTYTSPHLIRYNERVCLDGMEVSELALCESFERIDRARNDITLTYFEFGTLAAMDIFQRADIDIAVMEVGLGGRLDAVNCLDADVALISSIDLDHENWLGNNRESIAREKSGIFRSQSPAVCIDTDPPCTLVDYANELKTDLYLLEKDFNYTITGDTWTWQWQNESYTDLPLPSLYNSCQVSNAAGVIMVLKLLEDQFRVDDTVVRQGLQEFNLSGRFQVVPDKAQLILDVAHNREAAELLVKNLKNLPVKGKTHVLIGMLKDKNHNAVLREISAIADAWHLVTLENPRGAENTVLANVLHEIGIQADIHFYDTVTNALNRIRTVVEPQDRIVITGSFLTVGAAIKHLNLQH